MTNILRDPSLAAAGARKIAWVREFMPLLAELEGEFRRERPLAGLRVAMSIHLEAKTARMALLMRDAGAQVRVTGCNPLSTQDDVAAALAEQGVGVCAWHGASENEYHDHLISALSIKPHIIVDDGGDLVQLLCGERPDLAESLIGGSEETTTGVMRLRARAKAGKLPFPMLLVNDARMKYLFDNRYGTGQSAWDGIMRTTNLLVAGKTVVVCGYGWCARGIAMRAKGLGARVVVCEIDPVKAVEAAMDGFTPMKMLDAAPLGDLFITSTGCRDVITMEHFSIMKRGAVVCNAGHFDVEADVSALRREAVRTWEARNRIEGFELKNGNVVYILAGGRLVNLAAGDGHPAEIMDTSFALQALSAEYIAKNGRALAPGVHTLPPELDERVARLKLKTLGYSIDSLTREQREYLEIE